MQLRINGNELKQVLTAVSKDKYRDPLHCLHIERVGNRVEFATTDGSALVVMSRPLATYDDDLPEDFRLTVDLTPYKISDKNIYHLIEENGQMFLLGPDIKIAIMPYTEVDFPNYHSILQGFEDLPLAEKFALFSEANIKKLFKIFDWSDGLTPKAKSNNTPHYWSKKRGDSVWVVVLMPIRTK